jgi:mannose-6-phosphate isomerase-like protein (cupin superfamily)
MIRVANLETAGIQPNPHSFGSLLAGADSTVLRDSFILIPPEESAAGLTAGYTVIYPGCRTSGHAHGEYEEIYHITKGKGTMKIGDEEFAVKAGDTYLVPFGLFHATLNPHLEVLEYFWVLSLKRGG